jgi:alanine-alpha-ketoisovalerate/valine-pyruvate aminotransferase
MPQRRLEVQSSTIFTEPAARERRIHIFPAKRDEQIQGYNALVQIIQRKMSELVLMVAYSSIAVTRGSRERGFKIVNLFWNFVS